MAVRLCCVARLSSVCCASARVIAICTRIALRLLLSHTWSLWGRPCARAARYATMRPRAVQPLGIFYKSSGVVSHALFGAASMYAACKAISCGNAWSYYRDVMALGNLREPGGGTKWFWEVASWDNAWWDAAVLMLGHGVEGPEVYGRPAFTTFLGTFADKWVNGVAPIECACSDALQRSCCMCGGCMRSYFLVSSCWLVMPCTLLSDSMPPDPQRSCLQCRISPKGQRWVSPWGSNRYALGGAAILLMWADLPSNMRKGPVSRQNARCAAVKQIHYVAGDSDRGSFVAGFGSKPPQRNHHRNSACAPWEQRDHGGSCETSAPALTPASELSCQPVSAACMCCAPMTH
jgi:Glycosyl hydrolase family 9